MTINRRHQDGFSHSQILRLGLFLLTGGAVLFSFVWWPIQSECARRRLSDCETRLAQKKTELNILKARYAALTSLRELDQWASAHGPWRSPQAHDVILFPS
jgi:hypothetical protein